jgi:hypothetical protein
VYRIALVSVVRKRMATLWVLVERSLLGFRIRAVVVVVIGVVGLLVSLHNLTAQVLVDIPEVAADPVTAGLVFLHQCILRVTKQVQVRWQFLIQLTPPRL